MDSCRSEILRASSFSQVSSERRGTTALLIMTCGQSVALMNLKIKFAVLPLFYQACSMCSAFLTIFRRQFPHPNVSATAVTINLRGLAQCVSLRYPPEEFQDLGSIWRIERTMRQDPTSLRCRSSALMIRQKP